MIGPPPVLSMRGDTEKATAFLRLMLSTVKPEPAMRYQEPARGWRDAYRLRSCPCGGCAAPGARCVRCGQVVP